MRGVLLISLFILLGLSQYNLSAQCESWVGSPKQAEGEEAHSIYQGALESQDFNIAFEYWKTAYGIAPTADGKRASHFLDGITIYEHKYANAESAEEKKEFSDWILKLYQDAADCIASQSIQLSRCTDQACYDAEAGYYLGRRAYAMFYTFNSPRAELYQTAKRTVELAGNSTEYIVFRPLVTALVDQFQQGNVDVEEARELHKVMNDIIEHNIEAGGDYAEYYESAKNSVSNRIKAIEDDLYDCEYFLDKYVPEYEANKEDGETVERVYRLLKSKKCSDSLDIMIELQERYAVYVEEYNRAQLLELAKSNPGVAASLAYEEGRFSDAVGHYKEAIAQSDDDDKKADYYFNMASIQGRRLNQYSVARDNARKAAQLRPNWGRPYMLIGDLYATTSRDCGDSWEQRLAILAAIDKYAYAKQIDPSETSSANSRIATYNESKPQKEQAFMRGLSAGQQVKVQCWINETVTLRF